MGDEFKVEELLAEEDEVGYITSVIGAVTGFIASYGWFLVAGGAAAYFLWQNYGPNQPSSSSQRKPLSPQEVNEFQSKEEARQRYVAKLQEKYEKEAEIRAEKVKQMEEEKRKARLAELEKLETGYKLGAANDSSRVPGQGKGRSSKSGSLRPEYNPLMGDTSSNRSCFQRPSRSGG